MPSLTAANRAQNAARLARSAARLALHHAAQTTTCLRTSKAKLRLAICRRTEKVAVQIAIAAKTARAVRRRCLNSK